jgi:hypothetical protein
MSLRTPQEAAAQLQRGGVEGMNNRNDPSQSPEESNKQRQGFDDRANDLWSLYGKEAQIYYENWIKTLEGDMGGALIFVRVFFFLLANQNFDIIHSRPVYSLLFSRRSSC